MSRNRRKKNNFYSKTILIFILIIILMFLIKTTFSRYSSSGNSEADVDIAFYLVKEQVISEEIVLEEIIPGDSQKYTFSVANNDESQRTETALKYNVTIKATTNLPLTYNLYVNSDNEDAINEYETIQDENNTYFKTITSKDRTFGFEEDEQDVYQLEITFPEEYNSVEYQDIIEALEIEIDAQQFIQ